MEKLEYKYQTLLKAELAFSRAVKLYEDKFDCAELAEREAYVASVIKHFELFFETLWKFLKYYLVFKYGTETIGSKTIFRACFEHALINQEELEECLEIVDLRNAASHVYDEQAAYKMSQAVVLHAKIMKLIVSRVGSIENLNT